jgi:hypothetical protein
MTIEIIPRPDITRAIARGTARHLRQMGYAVVTEMVFANNRRADLVGIAPQGEIVIIEIKSCIADYRADAKWQDYREYCDHLAFAVGLDFPAELIPEDTGLIIADAFGAEWLRIGQQHPLVAARRKAVTLQFARLAASRLHVKDDPDFGTAPQ